MVLIYHVDVHALPGLHQGKIMQLVNTCYKEQIQDLDFSYGVLYQDKGSVLGVALVNESQVDHQICHLCVRKENRTVGIATEILDLIKERIQAMPLKIEIASDWTATETKFFERRGFHQMGAYMTYQDVAS